RRNQIRHRLRRDGEREQRPRGNEPSLPQQPLQRQQQTQPQDQQQQQQPPPPPKHRAYLSIPPSNIFVSIWLESNSEKSTTTQRKSSHWISSVLQLLFAAISSGGFVGTCWCSIKCLRNGCAFKRAWVTPKSVAEYKRRKQIQNDQIVHYQPSTITQSISNSLSSQAL
ncbi:unnamed protein product, partial [Rotaria socialis]